MRRLLLIVCALLASPLAAVTPYVYGNLPAAASDANLTAAYSAWKTRRFKTITCGLAMAYVDNGVGGVFSEGMGYGALMAAYLDPDSTDFAKLIRFYEMKRDSRLVMNWNVPKDCGTDNGANAATDGDLDVALALIRAHRRWPAEGWGAKATTLLNAIYSNMVDSCQGLKNGDTWGGCSSGANNAYNPSYFRTAYMNSFNCFEGGTRWTAVRNRSYSVANYAYNNYALPPDWVRNDGTWGQATNSGGYGYDSCRSPWTFAQDYLWWGNTNGQNWGGKIARVFGNKATWGSPATAAADVGDDYSYSSGAKVRGNHENAFLGGAAVAFMATTYTAHLNAFYSNLVFTDNNSYYSDSLKVIYLMILTGNFQEPCYGPGPIPTATPTASPTSYAGTPTQTPLPAFGLMFEDFETGLSGGYPYAGSSSSLTYSRSGSAAYAGSWGDRMVVSVAAPQAYAGHGFASSYANGLGVFDATGATSVRFWVRSDKNVSFNFSFKEGGAGTGGDDEAWIAATTNVTGNSTWTQISIPISGMTEDANNPSCSPSCGTTGNGTKNLSAVKQVQFGFSLATAANVDIDNIEFVLAVAPTATPTRTPFIGSYNQVFDDMESSLSLKLSAPVYAGTYADTAKGASASITKSAASLSPGGGAGNTMSGALTYNTGLSGSYGAGGFLLSPYGTPQGYVDASGAVFLGLWVNFPVGGITYKLEFSEAGNTATPVAGADGEAWQSGSLTSQGGWEFVQVELGSFTEDPYNPTCNPLSVGAPGPCLTGGQAGNGVMNFQAINTVQLKLDGNQGNGTLYFDDLVFVTSFKTPTPTRTFTVAPSATFTPTPTRSPTSTPTPSFSYTASFTYTQTLTYSATPTQTNFAGSPTDTPPASATNTPTASPSASFTRTATPSATPSLSFTLTNTLMPTISFSMTATASRTPSSTPVQTPSLTLTSTASRTPSPTPVTTPNTIMDFGTSWTPSQLTITAGTTVFWGWVGFHDLRSDTGLWTAVPAQNNGSFNYTFNTPGTYRYYCGIHGGPGGVGMSGIIFVLPVTPTLTPSASPSPVQSPTFSATLTQTPIPGLTHTPQAGPLIADFATGALTLWQPGRNSAYGQVDSAGSTQTFALQGPGAAAAGNPATQVACIYGQTKQDAAPWPFANLVLDLVEPPAGGYDVTAVASANAINFNVRSAIASRSVRIQVQSDAIGDYGYYQFVFNIPDTAWHNYTVYFPGAGSPALYQPAWAIAVPWASVRAKMQGLIFGALPSPAAPPQSYDFCLDDIRFGAVAATATPTRTTSPTPTPAPSGDRIIVSTRAFPNPVLPGHGGVIRVELDQAVEGLSCKLYTPAMVQVGLIEAGAQSPGWVSLALPDTALGQPSGIYYYVVSARRNGTSLKAPKSGRLVLLH